MVPVGKQRSVCMTLTWDPLVQLSKKDAEGETKVSDEYSLNLSISVREGEETNEDSSSNGERRWNRPNCNLISCNQ